MADIEVSFPKPCSENWERMEEVSAGKHCATCKTIVHDLDQLTIVEAEKLLKIPEDVCVRARIQPDGSVAHAGSNLARRGKMTALVGATMSMTLATAACQSPFIGPVSPRLEITGSAPELAYSGRIELRSDTGEVYKTSVDWYGKFRITNLKPGVYSLKAFGTCNEHEFKDIVIRESDVDMGELKLTEADCIIIGVMTKAEDSRFT